MLKNDPIQDMLAIGAVSGESARIWLRVSRPGRYTLSWWPASGGQARDMPVHVEDRASDLTAAVTLRNGLTPDTRYRVTLHCDPRHPLAAGSFVTSPGSAAAAPLHFSIALMSCHQPFDSEGRVSATTEPMLEAVSRVLLEHRVRAVLMCGDQLYSDYPKPLSLFDPEHFHDVAPQDRDSLLACSADEVRALFQQRYRHFWNIRGWRELLANYACYPILDDHEIVDNWGSVEAHQQEAWQAFRRGAFQAYADYQALRVSDHHAAPPECFDYTIDLADVAVYVMDLRSNRRTGTRPQLVSPAQLDAVRRFLHRQRDRRALFLVLSVPLLHLPRSFARLASRITPEGEDFSDRWSSRGHCRDRDALLAMLRHHQAEHPEQHLVLLSGDIHIGCLHRIRWQDQVPYLYQFISSGVTHHVGPAIRVASRAIMAARRRVAFTTDSGDTVRGRISRVRGESGARNNPCSGLNVGIVELERSTPTEPPALRFLLYSHDGSQPRCVFRSPPIAAPGRQRLRVGRSLAGIWQADR